MPQAVAAVENKPSSLLSSDENQVIVRLLGGRCQTLATTVAQLYQTQPPHHAQWVKKDTGVLCLVKDNFRKNYFFRMYCFKRNAMIYEQELYSNMDYIVSCPFLHTFEGDDCMIGFSFANDDEAREMKLTVDQKLHARRRREDKRSRITSEPNNTNNNSIKPQTISSSSSTQYPSSSIPSTPLKLITRQQSTQQHRRNLTKADIGQPSAFRHIAHVGWDPDRGFAVESLDDDLKTFFQKAGVSETHLKDKETRKFIYDFIESNGGREAVEKETRVTGLPAGGGGGSGSGSGSGGGGGMAGKPLPPVPGGAAAAVPGPPVPPRGAPKPPSRVAPKPPSQSPPTRAPPQTPVSNRSTNNASTPVSSIQSPVPPPPPPPPPPMLPSTPVNNNEAPIVTSQRNQSQQPPVAVAADPRSALMESIRSGSANLKRIEVDERKTPAEPDARDGLLCEIRKGFQLKPANEREVKPISPPAENGGNDLAAALNRALRERNRVIHSEDDSNSDETDDDDEWEA